MVKSPKPRFTVWFERVIVHVLDDDDFHIIKGEYQKLWLICAIARKKCKKSWNPSKLNALTAKVHFFITTLGRKGEM